MPGVWPLLSCIVFVILMDHAAINNVISMYHTLIYMLATIWLLMRNEFSTRMTQALGRTHQKPRRTNWKAKIKRKERTNGNTGRSCVRVRIPSRSLSLFTRVRSLSVFYDFTINKYWWKRVKPSKRNRKSIEWWFPSNFQRFLRSFCDAQSSIFHLNDMNSNPKSIMISV